MRHFLLPLILPLIATPALAQNRFAIEQAPTKPVEEPAKLKDPALSQPDTSPGHDAPYIPLQQGADDITRLTQQGRLQNVLTSGRVLPPQEDQPEPVPVENDPAAKRAKMGKPD